MADFEVSGFGSVKLNKDIVDTHPYNWSIPPKYLHGIAKTTERQFMVQNINDADGPYTFTIPDVPGQVINGASVTSLMVLQIETSGGNPAQSWNEVGICPDIGNCLFDSIQVSINDEAYTELTQEHYPYKAYIEKLLKHGAQAQQNHLATALFLPDDSNFLTNEWVAHSSTKEAPAVPDKMKVKNFWKRSAYALGNSGKFSISTPLHLDIFQASRFMPPGLKFTLTFHRTPPKFYIMCKADEDADALVLGTQDYRIKILDFRLEVNYVTLDGPLKSVFSENRNFMVPFNKVNVHKTQFPVGYTTLNYDVSRGGVMPRQLVIGMVDTKAFQGDFLSSPFVFGHYNIGQIGLKINGEHHPIEPLTMDFTDNAVHYAHAYQHFLRNIGHEKRDLGCYITMENYPFGFTLFSFDLSNDRSNNYHLFEPHSGSLTVEIKLKKAFAAPITLLIFACYNKLMEINHGQIAINDI